MIDSTYQQFIQIPGPNPILKRGGPGEWDESCIEACDIFKDYDTYHLYYHGVPADHEKWPRAGYRVGVATARHPLGPWTKYEGNPLLDLGPEGSWEDRSVACAFLHKEGADRYFMWYSGAKEKWSVGLATAASPLGPWTKHPGNPLLPDFGYVGGVVKVGDLYRMYNEHPIGETGPDYGPISLATADAPEGPWTPYEGNPVLPAGEWGAWDDGGYSESKVLYREGLYHVFYGAAKLHPTRILSQESIGYACSLDGVHFIKHPLNPVAPREHNPNAAAFAEVHSLIEPPFVYCFHTLRYVCTENPHIEDLGVQVLATQRPFCLPMPVLQCDSLAPGATTALDDCPPISLEHANATAISVECEYDETAAEAVRLHLRCSYDGRSFDTEDIATFDNDLQPGTTGRRTVPLGNTGAFIKVMAKNLDTRCEVRNLRVVATLKG